MQVSTLLLRRGLAASCCFALLTLLIGGCPGTPVDPPPGRTLDVPVEGQGEVEQTANGDVLTFTAVPDEGWQFDGWSGSVTSTQNPLTITVNDNTTLNARFVEIPPADTDADDDEVADADDDCPNTPAGATVNADGCAENQLDSDNDGVTNDLDQCADTPAGSNVDSTGCPSTDPDADGDGVLNADDDCPGTAAGATVNADGCATSQLDTDGDGVRNDRDLCAGTAAGATVNAAGCSTAQRDSDDDGITDDKDQCADTPADAAVDATGCPADPTADADGDGVPNGQDNCPDTGPGRQVDANGCIIPPGGGGGGPTPTDADGDGVTDANDQCPDTPPGQNVGANGCEVPGDADADGVPDTADLCADTPSSLFPVDANGCPEVCGRASGGCGTPHSTPGCNDSTCCNTICSLDSFCCETEWDGNCVEAAADMCSGVTPLPDNNACETPTVVMDGTTPYSNTGATRDGPIDSGICAGVRIGADVWFTYTASCTGVAIVGLCGSRYDTTLAVYNGAACPSSAPLACSDDDCLVLESRTTLPVTQGQTYMIRVGGYADPLSDDVTQGQGDLTIHCGPDGSNTAVCGPGSGDCRTATSTRGCGDAECCNTVCENDPTCCDVIWDDICAQQAAGLCDGSFAACGAQGAGACNQGGDAPGCDNATCCNAVCTDDPYCCVAVWDSTCATAAAANPACQ